MFIYKLHDFLVDLYIFNKWFVNKIWTHYIVEFQFKKCSLHTTPRAFLKQILVVCNLNYNYILHWDNNKVHVQFCGTRCTHTHTHIYWLAIFYLKSFSNNLSYVKFESHLTIRLYVHNCLIPSEPSPKLVSGVHCVTENHLI